jgi:hypothetical protein
MRKQLKINNLRATSVQEKGEVTMLERIRNFQADRMDLDELTELSAVGRILVDEFERLSLEVPDWVTANLKSLRREIKTRVADQLEKSLRDKKTRLEALKPAEQKRTDLQAEIDKLEKQLQSV